ncbi:MAG: GNAT family N-acetyltransferase [Polyangiales bacterium]
MNDPTIQWRPYEPSMWASYRSFAERNFGANSYQARESFLQWLYIDDPHAASDYKDFLVGVANERVVGCMHKMRISWRIDGVEVSVPAVHDLMVDPEYRSGLGAMLMLAALRKEEHAFIAGTVGDVSLMYEKIGCQPLQTFWGRRMLSPLSGALSWAITKARRGSDDGVRLPSGLRENGGTSMLITTAPTDAELKAIANAMQKRRSNTPSPAWSSETLRWRFFSEHGPKHLLVLSDGEDGFADFLIFSLGPHHGLSVVRLLEASTSTSQNFASLLNAHTKTLRQFGAHVLLVYSADPSTIDGLQRAGIRAIDNPPRSFLYHRNKKKPFAHYAIPAAAADFGLEAIR